MANVLVEETSLQNIANSIREKTGTEDTYKPSEMASAISEIQSGGNSELEASYISSIDNTSGANVTKLPNGITSIGKYAFYYCENLTSLEIPSGVTSIGNYAFSDCKKLATLVLPNSVTSIGERAFQGCANLRTMTLPDGITSVKNSTFSGCTTITSIVLPENLTSIEEYVFNYCENLTSLEIPSGVTSIGKYAFNYCENLTSLEIPSGVTSIENSTYSYCTKLQKITFLGQISKINFNGSYNAPFRSCSKLTTFALPNVTSVPTVSTSDMFSSTPIASGNGYIYVPDTLVDSFKSATNWSAYATKIKPISELPTE